MQQFLSFVCFGDVHKLRMKLLNLSKFASEPFGTYVVTSGRISGAVTNGPFANDAFSLLTCHSLSLEDLASRE